MFRIETHLIAIKGQVNTRLVNTQVMSLLMTVNLLRNLDSYEEIWEYVED